MPEIVHLELAVVELPESHPAAEFGRTVPVHGFLIRHPDGPILVDTGVGFGNEFIDDLYKPPRTELGAGREMPVKGGPRSTLLNLACLTVADFGPCDVRG